MCQGVQEVVVAHDAYVCLFFLFLFVIKVTSGTLLVKMCYKLIGRNVSLNKWETGGQEPV